MNVMQFVIITGMSGSGKSSAVNVLEDIGYYCVDNMPPELIPKFANICSQSDGKIDKVAFVVDKRRRPFSEASRHSKAASGRGRES